MTATTKHYRDMEERLIVNSIVDPVTGCWPWLGKQSGGYGKLNVWDKVKKCRITLWAHRVAYETFIGPIDEGMEVDHMCENTICINPNHLQQCTGLSNTMYYHHGRYIKREVNG